MTSKDIGILISSEATLETVDVDETELNRCY